MRTPAGKECHFYYENFHRGRSIQECRLIQRNLESPRWQPSDCSKCPVPEILQANNSPNLVLQATVHKGFLGFNRRVEVKASCSRHLIPVHNPHVGCPKCAQEKPGLKALFEND
jgi:hypothetical protein